MGGRAGPAEGIEPVIVAVDRLRKRDVLARILQAKPAGQTLVFTRTKYGADKLVTFLRREGVPAHAIPRDKAQSQERKSTPLKSSHSPNSYAGFFFQKKKKNRTRQDLSRL